MNVVTSLLGGISIGVIASLFTLGACGGDKSAPASSMGGSNASVGGGGNPGGSTSTNTSAGGSTSGGGNNTAGGSTGGPKVVPTNPLMTDFSEVAPGTVANTSTPSFNWGDSTKTLTGGTFVYGQDPAPTNADSPTGTITDGALGITAAIAVGHYSGFGFYFGPNQGSDACAYAGFSFTIMSSSTGLGGSTVDIQVQMTPDYPLHNANKGTCDYITADAGMWSYCTNPHVQMATLLTGGVTAAAQTVQVPWSVLTGGNPVSAIDCHQLLGIQLQFNCPSAATAPCNVNVTMDNLTFY